MQEYFDAARFSLGSRGMRKPWAQVITSRGCPYNCVFCSIHTIWGRQWRYRRPENVVEEIETIVSKYKIKEIDFEDDNLTLNRKRAEKIFDLLTERDLGIEWHTPNGVRADTLDEPLLRKMKRSGCSTIWIGVESGDQDVLDNIIRKNLKLDTVEHVVKLPHKVGIQVGCFLLLG